MKKMKEPLSILLLCVGMLLSSCSGKNSAQPCDVTTIDLGDRFEKMDTFDCHEVLGINYATADTLNLKIQTDAQIVKAEKLSYYYPTMWSDIDDDLIQFIYLYDQEAVVKEELNVDNNIIQYPVGSSQNRSLVENNFRNITREEAMRSIENVPYTYQKRKRTPSYELENWSEEVDKWKKIASKLKKGDFVTPPNEPFSYDPETIELVVTFKDKNREFTKTFTDLVIIGN